MSPATESGFFVPPVPLVCPLEGHTSIPWESKEREKVCPLCPYFSFSSFWSCLPIYRPRRREKGHKGHNMTPAHGRVRLELCPPLVHSRGTKYTLYL